MKVYRNIIYLIGVLCFLLENVSAGVCPRVKTKFCSELDGLEYENTFFPNILGHSNQKEAKEALKLLEPLAETECSPYISAFLCAAYIPACPTWKDNPKRAQKPCRELCETARKDCEGVLLDTLGLAWPAELNCDDLPSYDKSRRNPVCTNYQPPRPTFCKKHKEVGPCFTYKPYWYYDVMEHKCMTFTFGGCGGNDNKFETKEECMKVCGNDSTSTVAAATTQTDGGETGVTMTSSPSKAAGDAITTEGTTMASGTEETAGSETQSAGVRMTSSPVSGQTDKSMEEGEGSRNTSPLQPTDGSTAKPMEGGSPSQTSGNGTDAPGAVSTMPPMGDGTTQSMTSTMMFSTQSSRTTKEPDGLPVIVNNLDNQVVITGGSVEFRCIARGATEYSWKRIDGIYPMEKVDMEDYDRIQGAVLRMVDLAPEDAGIYACVASNGDGYVEALVTLTVVVAPTIETIESPQFVREGDRLEIECIGDGVPPPTMLWERKNGMKVRSKGSRSKRTMVIRNASPSDAGTYYCIAVNQAGHANYTVEIQIETGVEIIADIQSQTIFENETAFFVCSAIGNPEPQFSWRRLDGEFPDESRVVIEGPIVNRTLDYPIYSSILGIEPTFAPDAGSYQCYAFNSVGNYTAVGDLTVVGPPTFSQKPVAYQSVSVGDSAYFTCIGSGVPAYEITWTKEFTPGWPEGDSRVILEDDNTFLKINDVVPDDSGVYMCIIGNEFGTISASSNLQVEEALAILIGPSDTRATPGETVEFRCRVTGNPFPTVKWLFNEIAIDPLGLLDRRVEQRGTNLIIRNVQVYDSGHYHCLAWSIHGKVMATAVLTVANGLTTYLPTERGETEINTDLAESMETSMPGSFLTDEPSMETMGTSMPGDDVTVFEDIETMEPIDGTDAPKVSPETQGSTEAMGSPETQKSTLPMSSTEPETGMMMGMTSGSPKGGETDSPMSTITPESKSTMSVAEEVSSPMTSMMSSTAAPLPTPKVLPRRTDITNPGKKDFFSGWVDVQGQGANNDFCRIIERDFGEYQLACSLAGTEGEEEFNYVSGVGFDLGEKDTWYMKDENGDGRYDYCRCTSTNGKRYVWCTAAGENGFYGNEKDEPNTNEHSFEANGVKVNLKNVGVVTLIHFSEYLIPR